MLAGACLYIGALAVIMAIRAVTLVSTWNAENRASEFRRSLEVLRDAGLSASGAETVYKVLATAVAVFAACGAVFAIYAARGQRSSRLGLTIAIGIAGTATFLGVIGGTFLFAMVGALAVAFTIRLWTGEIRTYFRTLAGHEPPAPKRAPADPFAVPPRSAADTRPAEEVEYTLPSADEVPPAPVSQPYAPQYGYHQPPHGREALPRSVSIAVWTTFIGSVIVAVGSALGLLGLGLVGDDYERMMRDSPFSDSMMDQSNLDYDQAYRLGLTMLGICFALALAGLAAAIQVLVKKRTGGVFLFVMTVVTAITSVLFFPVGLPWTAAAIVCWVQLRKPESRAWFAKR